MTRLHTHQVHHSYFDLARSFVRMAYCEKVFDKQYELNRHLKKHDPPFQCPHPHCRRRFQYRKDLERRRQEKHNEPGARPSYQCPDESCERHRRPFSRRANHKDHFRRKHSSYSTGPKKEMK
ncbi:hypothetical protein VTN96DRAFT_4358 [Rasamsonia emersonii]